VTYSDLKIRCTQAPLASGNKQAADCAKKGVKAGEIIMIK